MDASDALPANDADRILAAQQCVEGFVAGFNARDVAQMDSFTHFPHLMLMVEDLIVWEAPGSLSASFFEEHEKTTGWATTVIKRNEPVLVKPEKVHLIVQYDWLRADGSLISSHVGLWIVTCAGGRWALKQRSY